MVPKSAGDHTLEARRIRVLVLEEDFITRWDVAEYLRETGFDVFEAVNAPEAKAILALGTKVDAVVCSVSLAPKLDGHEFFQWVGLQYPNLPVLFSSMDRAAAELVDETPTRRFVAKPYVLGSLEQHLRQLIARNHVPK